MTFKVGVNHDPFNSGSGGFGSNIVCYGNFTTAPSAVPAPTAINTYPIVNGVQMLATPPPPPNTNTWMLSGYLDSVNNQWFWQSWALYTDNVNRLAISTTASGVQELINPTITESSDISIIQDSSLTNQIKFTLQSGVLGNFNLSATQSQTNEGTQITLLNSLNSNTTTFITNNNLYIKNTAPSYFMLSSTYPSAPEGFVVEVLNSATGAGINIPFTGITLPFGRELFPRGQYMKSGTNWVLTDDPNISAYIPYSSNTLLGWDNSATESRTQILTWDFSNTIVGSGEGSIDCTLNIGLIDSNHQINNVETSFSLGTIGDNLYDFNNLFQLYHQRISDIQVTGVNLINNSLAQFYINGLNDNYIGVQINNNFLSTSLTAGSSDGNLMAIFGFGASSFAFVPQGITNYLTWGKNAIDNEINSLTADLISNTHPIIDLTSGVLTITTINERNDGGSYSSFSSITIQEGSRTAANINAGNGINIASSVNSGVNNYSVSVDPSVVMTYGTLNKAFLGTWNYSISSHGTGTGTANCNSQYAVRNPDGTNTIRNISFTFPTDNSIIDAVNNLVAGFNNSQSDFILSVSNVNTSNLTVALLITRINPNFTGIVITNSSLFLQTTTPISGLDVDIYLQNAISNTLFSYTAFPNSILSGQTAIDNEITSLTSSLSVWSSHSSFTTTTNPLTINIANNSGSSATTAISVTYNYYFDIISTNARITINNPITIIAPSYIPNNQNSMQLVLQGLNSLTSQYGITAFQTSSATANSYGIAFSAPVAGNVKGIDLNQNFITYRGASQTNSATPANVVISLTSPYTENRLNQPSGTALNGNFDTAYKYSYGNNLNALDVLSSTSITGSSTIFRIGILTSEVGGQSKSDVVDITIPNQGISSSNTWLNNSLTIGANQLTTDLNTLSVTLNGDSTLATFNLAESIISATMTGFNNVASTTFEGIIGLNSFLFVANASKVNYGSYTDTNISISSTNLSIQSPLAIHTLGNFIVIPQVPTPAISLSIGFYSVNNGTLSQIAIPSVTFSEAISSFNDVVVTSYNSATQSGTAIVSYRPTIGSGLPVLQNLSFNSTTITRGTFLQAQSSFEIEFAVAGSNVCVINNGGGGAPVLYSNATGTPVLQSGFLNAFITLFNAQTGKNINNIFTLDIQANGNSFYLLVTDVVNSGIFEYQIVNNLPVFLSWNTFNFINAVAGKICFIGGLIYAILPQGGGTAWRLGQVRAFDTTTAFSANTITSRGDVFAGGSVFIQNNRLSYFPIAKSTIQFTSTRGGAGAWTYASADITFPFNTTTQGLLRANQLNLTASGSPTAISIPIGVYRIKLTGWRTNDTIAATTAAFLRFSTSTVINAVPSDGNGILVSLMKNSSVAGGDTVNNVFEDYYIFTAATNWYITAFISTVAGTLAGNIELERIVLL